MKHQDVTKDRQPELKAMLGPTERHTTYLGLNQDHKKDVAVLSINDRKHMLVWNTKKGTNTKIVPGKFSSALRFGVDYFADEGNKEHG